MSEHPQNQYLPERVSPPGETLADILEERGMSQAELARHMGRPAKTINEIIKARAQITPETAIELERVLGIPAEFWNRREADYRASLARSADARKLQRSVKWGQLFPWDEIAALINPRRVGRPMNLAFGDPMDILCFLRTHLSLETGEDAARLLQFFATADPKAWKRVWHRQAESLVPTVGVRDDRFHAITAWLRLGEIEADPKDIQTFAPTEFQRALEATRGLRQPQSENLSGELIQTCGESGVIVVLTPRIESADVTGAAYWRRGAAVIQLADHYNSADEFWTTFYRLAGHLLLHPRGRTYLELGSHGRLTRDERRLLDEADRFARGQLDGTAAAA